MSKLSFLRTINAVVLLIAPVLGCDGGGPALRVSAQGNVILVTNADKGVVEIKDIIVNDRDECTYIEPLPKTKPMYSWLWLEGGVDLDNNDRRQLWLHRTAETDPLDALKPTDNGKYNVCRLVCPEGYIIYHAGNRLCQHASKGASTKAANERCEKSSVVISDKIILNVGDEKRWSINRECQKVIRAKILTDKGTNEYNFY